MAKWDIKLNLTSLLLFLATVVGILIGVYQWRQRVIDNNFWAQNSITQAQKYATYVIKSNGTLAATRQSLMLTQDELEAAMVSDSINKEMAGYYKKLSEQVTIVTEYVHDSVLIPIPCPIDGDLDTIIPYTDECMDLNFVFSDGFMYMDDISIPNQQDILVGLRKNGLRKAYWAVDVHNSNPCIRVTDFQSTHVVTKKKWFENPMIVGTLGILTGVIGWEIIR